MDEEILFVFVILPTLWVLIGALVLTLAARAIYGIELTLRRGVLAQALMLWAFPVWFFLTLLFALENQWTFRDHVFYYLLILPSSLGQIWVIHRIVRVPWYQSIVLWMIALIPGLMICYGSIPNIDDAAPRARVTKANGEMRSVTIAFWDYSVKLGLLPVPDDVAGDPLAATTIPVDATTTANYYFEGPSRVPRSLVEEGFLESLPQDPFRRKDPGTYSYGAGPIQGATVSFVLTSWGPDETSFEEEIERLFLVELKGNPSAFKKDARSQRFFYSPTNGTVSPGDLMRGGPW